MKVALLILPLCLFITLSLKRARNPHHFIIDKNNAQIQITEDEDAKGNNIGRHPAVSKNTWTTVVLGNDDISTSFVSRPVITGTIGYYFFMAFNKYVQYQTENRYSDVNSGMPLQLFNKGSPKNDNIIAYHDFINFNNNYCLYKLLHAHYIAPLFSFDKSYVTFPELLQYSIFHLQLLFLVGTAHLIISERHSFSGTPAVCLSIIENILFPP